MQDDTSTQHSPSAKWLLVFFCRTILIQSPAQANNFKFPAMASPRRVIFLILVRICLPAHERASGWPQSGGSHNSDAEICRSSAKWGVHIVHIENQLSIFCILGILFDIFCILRSIQDSQLQTCILPAYYAY